MISMISTIYINEFQDEINELKNKYGNEYESCFFSLFMKLTNETIKYKKSGSSKNLSSILSSTLKPTLIEKKEIDINFISGLRKGKNKKKSDSIQKINHISLNLSSIKNLVNEGWKIENNFEKDFKINKENGLTIGFLGNYLEGKTYYFNKIFNTNIELKPTESINYYFLNDKKVRVLDIPGLNKPLLQNNFNEKKILESKIKDFIVEKFVLDNCLILIMIIESFNLTVQKKLEKLKKTLYENYSNQIVMKSIYIIHNNFKISNDEEYSNYINTNFPKDNYYNTDDIIYSEKLDIIENKFEILHFIPKLYNESQTEEVIKRLRTHIFHHMQLELLDFKEMLQNTFKKIGKTLFDMDNCKLKIENNNFRIEFDENEKKEKEKEYENLNEEEKLYNQLKNFNKLVSWNNFRIKSPHYCCFIDNNNNFVVQIELVNFKSIKIHFKVTKLVYIFYIVAKNNEPDKYKKMIQNTRINDDVNFEFKIPIDTFIFNSYKYNSYTYDKGLVSFVYSSLDIDENE